MFYNDMEPSIAAAHASTLTHHSIPAFLSIVTHAGYKHIPSTYVFCEQDVAVPLRLQEYIVARAEAAEPVFGGAFKRVILPSGHSPFLSMPMRIVEIIETAIQETKSGFIPCTSFCTLGRQGSRSQFNQ